MGAPNCSNDIFLEAPGSCSLNRFTERLSLAADLPLVPICDRKRYILASCEALRNQIDKSNRGVQRLLVNLHLLLTDLLLLLCAPGRRQI